ncbi:hypothetical protein DsansV1_C29g0211391 [Dioscorea sansibarensis]
MGDQVQNEYAKLSIFNIQNRTHHSFMEACHHVVLVSADSAALLGYPRSLSTSFAPLLAIKGTP